MHSHPSPNLRDGLHHGQAHYDGANCVVVTVTRQATDTVVTVSQDLDTQLVVLLYGGREGGYRERGE